jgi:hypothetical protein
MLWWPLFHSVQFHKVDFSDYANYFYLGITEYSFFWAWNHSMFMLQFCLKEFGPELSSNSDVHFFLPPLYNPHPRDSEQEYYKRRRRIALKPISMVMFTVEMNEWLCRRVACPVVCGPVHPNVVIARRQLPSLLFPKLAIHLGSLWTTWSRSILKYTLSDLIHSWREFISPSICTL